MPAPYLTFTILTLTVSSIATPLLLRSTSDPARRSPPEHIYPRSYSYPPPARPVDRRSAGSSRLEAREAEEEIEIHQSLKRAPAVNARSYSYPPPVRRAQPINIVNLNKVDLSLSETDFEHRSQHYARAERKKTKKRQVPVVPPSRSYAYPPAAPPQSIAISNDVDVDVSQSHTDYEHQSHKYRRARRGWESDGENTSGSEGESSDEEGEEYRRGGYWGKDRAKCDEWSGKITWLGWNESEGCCKEKPGYAYDLSVNQYRPISECIKPERVYMQQKPVEHPVYYEHAQPAHYEAPQQVWYEEEKHEYSEKHESKKWGSGPRAECPGKKCGYRAHWKGGSGCEAVCDDGYTLRVDYQDGYEIQNCHNEL